MTIRPASLSFIILGSMVACGRSGFLDDSAPGGGGGATTWVGSAGAPATTMTTSWTTTSSDTTSSTITTSTTTMDPPPLMDPGVRLAQGAKPWCIKRANGTVVCNETYPDDPGGPMFVDLPGIEDAEAVVRSLEYGCVLHVTGAVSCWGFSHKGQLGLAVPVEETSDVPLLLPGVTLVKITSGHHSVCGIEPSGQAVCWGGSYSGPLGDPSVAESQTPVNVLGIPDAIDISNFFEVACAVRAGGTVHCWRTGEAPHQIAGIEHASQVSVSVDRICAVVDGGNVVCWDGFEEQLAPIPGIDDARQVSVGTSGICARRASGQVPCWWEIPSTAEDLWPSPVDDAVDIMVPVQSDRMCAVRATGDVVCWKKGTSPAPFPG